MSSLLSWFRSLTAAPKVLLLDGGVSTFLESVLKKKNEVFRYRELWSSSLLLTEEGRNDIKECHKAFFKAGADIASTVTYQCHYGVFDGRKPLLDDATVSTMLRDGVRLARDAATDISSDAEIENTPKYVIGSIGCYGGALADGSEYKGNYGLSVDKLIEFHRRKSQLFLEESVRVDGLAFETIPCKIECEAICSLLKDLSQSQQDLPAVWISLACQNDHQLNDGTNLEEALDMICKLDPDGSLVTAVGINCCDSLYVPSLLKIVVNHLVSSRTRRGIVFYPNSGEQWDAKNESWLEGTGCTTPSQFASRMMEGIKIIQTTWNESYLNGNNGSPAPPPPKIIVGGCCRTSPSTIAAIRKELNKAFPTD